MPIPSTWWSVLTVSGTPPYAYAALSLAVPLPGIVTCRSRGTESTVTACARGLRRTSIIVSERASCLAAVARWSEPINRIV